MGDTGSLALGGALGAVAVATHHEFVLVIIGGLFVLEAVSVVIQVVCLQALRQARLQDGADPPSFRASRLERADRRHPLLDRQLRPCARRPVHAQAEVITAKAFAGKHYAVSGWRAGPRDGRGAAGQRGAGDGVGREGGRGARATRPAGRDRRSRRSRPQPIRLPASSPRPPPQPPPDRAARAPRRRDHRRHRAVRPRRPELPPHKVVGITGTNGKSTTTALVHHILKTAGVPSAMGGNIGLPILGAGPAARRRGLCARAVELPDRPDPEPRLATSRCCSTSPRPPRPLRELRGLCGVQGAAVRDAVAPHHARWSVDRTNRSREG